MEKTKSYYILSIDCGIKNLAYVLVDLYNMTDVIEKRNIDLRFPPCYICGLNCGTKMELSTGKNVCGLCVKKKFYKILTPDPKSKDMDIIDNLLEYLTLLTEKVEINKVLIEKQIPRNSKMISISHNMYIFFRIYDYDTEIICSRYKTHFNHPALNQFTPLYNTNKYHERKKLCSFLYKKITNSIYKDTFDVSDSYMQVIGWIDRNLRIGDYINLKELLKEELLFKI